MKSKRITGVEPLAPGMNAPNLMAVHPIQLEKYFTLDLLVGYLDTRKYFWCDPDYIYIYLLVSSSVKSDGGEI